MVIAAIVSERLVGVSTGPSAFGGSRARLTELGARIDLHTLAFDDDGLDVGRLLSTVPEGAEALKAGDARRVGALLRPAPAADAAAAAAAAAAVDGDGDAASLDAIIAAFAARLAELGVRRLCLPERVRATADADAVCAACAAVGVEVTDLVPALAGPGLFVDDAEVVAWPGLTVLMNSGQRATLAAGLARDVVAALVAAGGVAGAAVWDGGFDGAARALLVQRVERRLRAATGQVLRLDMAELLPPLSSFTSKARAVAALPSPSARALELATAHRRQQRLHWNTWRRSRFEMRLPAGNDDWWTERVGAIVDVVGAGAVVNVVGADSQALQGLVLALEGAGLSVVEPAARWLTGGDDVVGMPTGGSVGAAPAVPARIGGVRAAGDDVLLRTTTTAPSSSMTALSVSAPSDDASSLSSAVASSTTATSVSAPPKLWRRVPLPADATDWVVTVDGVVAEDCVVEEGADAARVLVLAPWVRAGSVVSIAWGRVAP